MDSLVSLQSAEGIDPEISGGSKQDLLPVFW